MVMTDTSTIPMPSRQETFRDGKHITEYCWGGRTYKTEQEAYRARRKYIKIREHYLEYIQEERKI